MTHRGAFDEALARVIDARQPALVVLAGFVRILTPGFVAPARGAAGQHPPVVAAGVSPGSTPTSARLMRALQTGRRRHGAPRDCRALDHGGLRPAAGAGVADDGRPPPWQLAVADQGT